MSRTLASIGVLSVALAHGLILAGCNGAPRSGEPSPVVGAGVEAAAASFKLVDDARLERDGWRVDAALAGNKWMLLPGAGVLLDTGNGRSTPGLCGLDGRVLIAPVQAKGIHRFTAASPGGELIVGLGMDGLNDPVQFSFTLRRFRVEGERHFYDSRTYPIGRVPSPVRVTPDGRLVQFGRGVNRSFFLVESESLDVQPVALLAGESGMGLSLSPRGVWAIEKEGSTRTIRRYEGIRDGQPRLGPLLTIPSGGTAVRIVGESLDGRYVVTKGRRKSVGRRLWEVRSGKLEDRGELEYDSKLDGDWLIFEIPGTGYGVRSLKGGKVMPVAVLPTNQPNLRTAHLDPRQGEALRLIEVGRDGVVRSTPITGRVTGKVRIGSDVVDWTPRPESARANRFADLSPSFEWAVRDGKLEVDLTVANRGTVDVFRVRGRLRIAAVRGADDRTVTIHLGRIAAGASVHRSLRIDAPELRRSAAVLTLRTRGQGDLPAPCFEELWFPLHIADSAAYDAKVRQVFDASVHALNELLGTTGGPRLLSSPGVMGFMGGGGEVIYQNPFAMDRDVQEINMRVMGVSDLDSLMRHAQMFPYWFIPHEVVHCYKPAASTWKSEFMANQVQPHLTAKLLESLDCPYTPEFMRAVYDRYIRVLRSTVTRAEADHIERFLERDGVGPGFPNEPVPAGIFRHRTHAYVYFGSRINQNSMARGDTLADMVQKYWPDSGK